MANNETKYLERDQKIILGHILRDIDQTLNGIKKTRSRTRGDIDFNLKTKDTGPSNPISYMKHIAIPEASP